MLVIFTVILLGLLVLGLPVAFSLGTAGLFGMFGLGGRCGGLVGSCSGLFCCGSFRLFWVL